MMRRNLLYLSIILTFFASCKKVGSFLSFPGQKPTEQSSVDSLKDGDRPSDSSGGVPGYLTLGCSVGLTLDGLSGETRCLASGPNGKVNLSALATRWSWDYQLAMVPAGYTISIMELGQENSDHVVYQFTGPSREKIIELAQQARYSVKLSLKGQTNEVVLQENLPRRTTISAAPRYRYIRITFPSLKQPWPDSQELDIEALELKWENQWRLGTFTDFVGRIGPYEAVVSASSYAADRSSYPFNAFRRSAGGHIWETAFRTYQTVGNFDAVGTPQWLKIDFKDHPVAIQGIRIDGGDGVYTQESEGSPDAFYLEGSQDDLNWKLIDGSRYENVDTTVLSTFEWK